MDKGCEYNHDIPGVTPSGSAYLKLSTQLNGYAGSVLTVSVFQIASALKFPFEILCTLKYQTLIMFFELDRPPASTAPGAAGSSAASWTPSAASRTSVGTSGALGTARE